MTGGQLRLADDLVLTRMGFGAMRLTGPGVWGPPVDRDEAIAVLRGVVELGLTHIDTSDYYGPYVVNELIREALHPYPEQLRIVTKVGARRTPDRGWHMALSPEEIVQAVHDNLRRLGVDAMDVVNLRLSVPEPTAVEEPLSVLVRLQQEGLIRHLGVSNVSAEQFAVARDIAPIVCVQNLYNVAVRGDDPLVDLCEAEGIAFVPFFPLGGYSPLQLAELDAIAKDLGATPMQTALAWLLHRSPTILLIPGTSVVAHLRENVAAAGIELPEDVLARLDTVADAAPPDQAERGYRR
jgi:aryl-alcohol dehydrogenase-like predicted oxidoreductase